MLILLQPTIAVVQLRCAITIFPLLCPIVFARFQQNICDCAAECNSCANEIFYPPSLSSISATEQLDQEKIKVNIITSIESQTHVIRFSG